MDLASDGKLIAADTSDDKIMLWDVDDRRPLLEIEKPATYFVRVPLALSPDRSMLACGTGDAVNLYDVATGKELGKIPFDLRPNPVGNGILCLKFSPNGKWLATGDVRGVLSILDVAKRKTLRSIPAYAQDAVPEVSKAVQSLDISSDGQWIVTAAGKNSVCLWSAATGKLHLRRKEESQHPHLVRFSPDATRVLVGDGRDIVVWEVSSGQTVQEFETARPIISADFCDRGRVVVTGHWDDQIQFWDVASGERFHTLQTDGHRYVHLRCSPDGRTLYTASSDSTILAWNVAQLLEGLPPLEKVTLTPDELGQIWQAFEGKDARAANRTIWRLVGAGGATACQLFREKLSIGRKDKLDKAKITRLIHELADDQFQVREAAFAKLSKLNFSIITLLKDELKQATSAELRARLTSLVTIFEQRRTMAITRSIHVLEYLATSRSLNLLEQLAQADADSLAARCAKSAVERMIRRDTKPDNK
ncbi:MAG: PQQ-binding-like beta-propeller repeat protein [Planctomycetes bacterium]|nr:PQQ-binding-like beta-propeller repeat protein [Planctomycetota bacterium]